MNSIGAIRCILSRSACHNGLKNVLRELGASAVTASACLIFRKSARRNWSSPVITGLPVSGLRQEIPLTDDELSAVQDGVAAYENLLTKLMDLPTPAGPSLRKINGNGLVQLATPAGHEGQPGRTAEKTKPRM